MRTKTRLGNVTAPNTLIGVHQVSVVHTDHAERGQDGDIEREISEERPVDIV